jgi:hypothetical protein
MRAVAACRAALGCWALAASLVSAGCGADAAAPTSAPSPTPPPLAERPLPDAADETALLDAAFRVDISRIDAVFDLFPGESRAGATARVSFHMRPGQTLPLFHFEPAETAPDAALWLDGERLDLASRSDARLFTFRGSGQTSLELERALPQGGTHLLEASWSFPLSASGGRFYTDVNDILGRGNEVLLPTLNTPHELARHRLVFRVHGAGAYLMVGSGLVTRTGSDPQEWVLDTQREVASYTVMFHLAPEATHTLSERRLAGVEVRVLAPSGGVSGDSAFALLEPWLRMLAAELGPFPMPRGLSVVLTQGGGGMEYYGATTTSLDALRHEVFHMYFGCSTIARTYRDSWWDEAVNMWYDPANQPLEPIDQGFRSGIVNDRSAIAKGFDTRAYQEGARIFQAVAVELGGRKEMVRFLRHLHERRLFDPITTWQLADEIQAWSGESFHERFRTWLYQGPEAERAGARAPSGWEWLHRVDMRLPSPRGR